MKKRATFSLRSTAFHAQGTIPESYTQAGENISPPLAWSGVPNEAKSLILIVEDPDAPGGTFTHWAAFDIDPSAGKLSEGEADMRQGKNDMGHARYDGPRPPKGDPPHHYHFRMAALDVDRLDVGDAPTHQEIVRAAKGHVIAQADLVGRFETH